MDNRSRLENSRIYGERRIRERTNKGESGEKGVEF